MTDPAVYARSYARALAQAAITRGLLREVRADMEALEAQWCGSPELRAFCSVHIPGPPSGDALRVRELWRDTFSEPTMILLEQLAAWQNLKCIPLLFKPFFALADAAEARVEIRVTFAQEPQAHELGILQNRAHKAFGSGATLTTAVNPDLVAGMVIRVGDKRIDASLAGRVTRLKRALAQTGI